MSTPYSTVPLPAPGMAVPGRPPTRRSAAAIVVGVVLIVAGLVGAGVLFFVQKSSYEDAVKNLQRTASGLETTFVFEKPGTFTIYYEYKGNFSVKVDGDTEDFEIDARETPKQVKLTLETADGDTVRLRREVGSVSYDVGGFAGSAYRTVEIREDGSYKLSIEPQKRQFAIAIGHGQLSKPTLLWPAVIAGAGVVLGLLLLLIGGRRRPLPASAIAAAPPSPVGAGWGAPAAAGGPDPSWAVPPASSPDPAHQDPPTTVPWTFPPTAPESLPEPPPPASPGDPWAPPAG